MFRRQVLRDGGPCHTGRRHSSCVDVVIHSCPTIAPTDERSPGFVGRDGHTGLPANGRAHGETVEWPPIGNGPGGRDPLSVNISGIVTLIYPGQDRSASAIRNKRWTRLMSLRGADRQAIGRPPGSNRRQTGHALRVDIIACPTAM